MIPAKKKMMRMTKKKLWLRNRYVLRDLVDGESNPRIVMQKTTPTTMKKKKKKMNIRPQRLEANGASSQKLSSGATAVAGPSMMHDVLYVC